MTDAKPRYLVRCDARLVICTQTLLVQNMAFAYGIQKSFHRVLASAGSVKRVGRCDSYATEFDLEAEEYVPMPKGDVHKKKEIVQVPSCPAFDGVGCRHHVIVTAIATLEQLPRLLSRSSC